MGSLWKLMGFAFALGLLFVLGPMLIIPGWPHSGVFAGCSRGLSDNEIMTMAINQADSLYSVGICDGHQVDSLTIDCLARALFDARRAKSLKSEMMKLDNYLSNNSALYGLALAYELENDIDSTLTCLEMAVQSGDYHLGIPDEKDRFKSLLTNQYFNNLVRESEINYQLWMEDKSVRVREDIVHRLHVGD